MDIRDNINKNDENIIENDNKMGEIPTTEENIQDIEDNELYKLLCNQADDLKASYSDADIEKELKNEKFLSYLDMGLDLKSCYELCHMDEIIASRLEKDLRQARIMLTEELKQNALLPNEEASLASNQREIIKPMFNSKKQREELAKRAMLGEIIKL